MPLIARFAAGFLPPRALGLVIEWAGLHKNELMDNWLLAAEKKELFQVEPLK
ncbi:MAG: DUF4160 domain-containing protein [bacterium]